MAGLEVFTWRAAGVTSVFNAQTREKTAFVGFFLFFFDKIYPLSFSFAGFAEARPRATN